MSSTVATSASATSSAPTSTGSTSPSGGPSSPLLFFVALGFGVVFTNLWSVSLSSCLSVAANMYDRIIVGVKYCFRYNQRNRARLAGEDPDAVDLAAMPRQRRRREKKLMTMDEVNEKFPLTKYKTWCSTRAEEGLPTAGGINATASRPVSVKNMARASEDDDKTKAQPSTNETLAEKLSPSEPSSPVAVKHDPTKTATSQTTTQEPVKKVQSNDEDGENDQIQTAIPAEQLPDPGDTCAICIDALEDDDDIRGLTCGHAFHASCVDPWLTARRACCPLCKADYYTPKPRPEGEAEELQRRRTLEQTPPGFLMMDRHRGPPFSAIGRYFFGGNRGTPGQPNVAPTPTSARNLNPAPSQTIPTEQQQQSWRTRLNLPRIPPLSRTRNGTNTAPGDQPVTSPAQLEAGQNR